MKGSTDLGYRVPAPKGPRHRLYRVSAMDGSFSTVVQPKRGAFALARDLALTASGHLPGVTVRVQVGHAIGDGPVTWEGPAVMTYTDQRPKRRTRRSSSR